MPTWKRLGYPALRNGLLEGAPCSREAKTAVWPPPSQLRGYMCQRQALINGAIRLQNFVVRPSNFPRSETETVAGRKLFSGLPLNSSISFRRVLQVLVLLRLELFIGMD